MTALRYLHLDVFAATPGGGNHLGVVLGAGAWDGVAMQRFARWTALVETTFVFPPQDPDAGYRVRIFTPMREIPFAGHPSIGSAHAAIACGIAHPRGDELRQECGAGILPIRITGDGAARDLLLRAPDAQIVATGMDTHPLLAAALTGGDRGALPPALVDGGRRWWLVELASEASLRTWHPDHAAIAALARATSSMGICAFARCAGGAYQLAVRAFASGAGITEDPASGAANGLLAHYLTRAEPHGALARGYVVSQGREIHHDARLRVRVDDRGIWVGGHCRTVIDGGLHWTPA